MLAAGQRLRRRDEFTAVLRGGRRAARGALVVHLGAARGDTHTVRVGFIIPRSLGRAVVRNKLRRRLRHLMRMRLDTLQPGCDVVVRALPGAEACSFQKLAEDLDAALNAARNSRDRR